MVMVVSSCPPSLHWERHQRLRLRMAIGVVLCLEIRQLHLSLLLCLRVPRYLPLLTVTKLHSCFSPPVAVSGTIGYMTGYNFVGSSCVEVPVATLSHALGFLLHTSSNGTRPHPGLLAASALSCWAATSVTTCCTSVTGVVRFGHLPVLLSFILSVRTFVFLVCVALIGVPPTKSYSFYWLQRSPCCGTLHRGPDRV